MECYQGNVRQVLLSAQRAIFQYPQTDRVECYWNKWANERGNVAFSILGRIVWNATFGGSLPPDAGSVHFQYPRTDRVECYYTVGGVTIACAVFQYPRTDRVECYPYRP